MLEEHLPPAGHVGIVSQSGNVGSFIMQNVADRGLGVSRFIATGNEADVDVADGIAALAADGRTRVILCCMETCRNAQRLIEALAMARQQRKPVIVLKIGCDRARPGRGRVAHRRAGGLRRGVRCGLPSLRGAAGPFLRNLLDFGHAASLLMPDRLPKGDARDACGGFRRLRHHDGRRDDPRGAVPARARRDDQGTDP